MHRKLVPHISRFCLQGGIARTSTSRFSLVPCSLVPSFPVLSHQRKQNHISNRLRSRQQHHQPVDADAFAACGRQTIHQRPHVVLVHLVRFVVAAARSASCCSKRLCCSTGSFSSLKALPSSKPPTKNLESLDVIRVVGLLLRERRDVGREVVDDGGLDEMRLRRGPRRGRKSPCRWLGAQARPVVNLLDENQA